MPLCEVYSLLNIKFVTQILLCLFCDYGVILHPPLPANLDMNRTKVCFSGYCTREVACTELQTNWKSKPTYAYSTVCGWLLSSNPFPMTKLDGSRYLCETLKLWVSRFVWVITYESWAEQLVETDFHTIESAHNLQRSTCVKVWCPSIFRTTVTIQLTINFLYYLIWILNKTENTRVHVNRIRMTCDKLKWYGHVYTQWMQPRQQQPP